MKEKLIGMLLMLLCLSSFSFLAVAQNMNEKALKRTEKARKDVAKAGIGTKSRVEVDLLNDKKYYGYIREANDKSFTVIDKNDQPTNINYSDVQRVYELRGSKKANYIALGAIAAGATVLVIFLVGVFGPH